MQYTKIYNNRRRGPMFDGSTETDEGLGIVTIDGRIDGDNKRHVIANVIITCKADIVVSWYDDSARKQSTCTISSSVLAPRVPIPSWKTWALGRKTGTPSRMRRDDLRSVRRGQVRCVLRALTDAV